MVSEVGSRPWVVRTCKVIPQGARSCTPRAVRMSLRPPARFTEKADFALWIRRFERYVLEAKIPDEKRTSELFPLLEDEPFRV